MTLQKAGMSLFLILFLFSCGTKEKDSGSNSDPSSASVGSESQDLVNLKTYGIEDSQFDTHKTQINPQDLRLAFLDKPTSDKPITKMGSDLMKKINGVTTANISNHTDGGVKKEELDTVLSKYDPSLVRALTLELSILDYKTKQPIKSGSVFVNGVNLGMLSDGRFSGTLQRLEGTELFNIMVRSPLYGDGFLSMNSLNSRGELLMGDVYMKKASLKTVTLGKDQTINIDKLTLKIKECSLVDTQGKCYTGKAELKVNFIEGEEANQNKLSLDMTAITQEGKVVQLRSGGMAFIEFITPNSEILQLKSGDTIEFTYQVSPDDILTMSNTKYGNGEKNGYWYYNKLAGVWQESTAKTTVDSKNNTVTITADVLY